MSTSKAFAYNPSLNPIDGTESFDSLVVGVDNLDFSQNPGGIKWWGGPDEDLAYVIASVRPGGQPVPAGVTGGPANVGFWKSKELTNQSFLNMANHIGAQNGQAPFATTDDAVIWLNNNGFYTSYGGTPIFSYYIGGFFTTIEGIASNRLVKISSDFVTINENFNIGSGFNSSVNAIKFQSDGKILVGGYFTEFNGASQNYLIRLNSDGSKDNTFNVGTVFNNGVVAIAVQSDGKILVGGSFTTFAGNSQNYLIRLNSDGSKDTSFNIGSGFDGAVNGLTIQSDGKVLVNGFFTSFNGNTQLGIIRLNSNGSKDSSFDVGTGADVRSLKLYSDGKILIGGSFTEYNGNYSLKNILRINSDGSVDNTFTLGGEFNFYATIYSVAIQNDGKIIAGGDFFSFSGEPQDKIIRLNSDGSKDNTFNIGSGANSNVTTIATQSDGKIFISGGFTSYNGVSVTSNALLNSDGSLNSSIDSDGNFTVIQS